MWRSHTIARSALLVSAAIVSAACAATSLHAQQSVEQFYKGRTVTLRIPNAPGGINDIVGRLIARYMPDFVPGHPSIVVQNLAGAGGLVSANKIYNNTERDGSVIAVMGRGTPQAFYMGDPNALFDPVKFTWLGSLSSYADDAYLLVINASHPVRNVDDLRKPGVSLKLGGQHSAATNTEFAMVAKVVLGLNIDVIRGYTGAAPMFLAMQTGEIDGQVIGHSSIRAGQPQLWDDGKVRPLIQFARDTRLRDFPDVPTGQELAPDADSKAVVEFAEMPFHMALPFVAPPDLPPDRAQALQTAFMQVTKDPAFLESAAKSSVDVSPIDGDAVRDILIRSAATPKDVIARFNDIISLHAAAR